MIEYTTSFGGLPKHHRGSIESRARGQRTIDEELGERSPSVTALTESADVLEEWLSENYREIIDKTEFLDSSRVKRND